MIRLDSELVFVSPETFPMSNIDAKCRLPVAPPCCPNSTDAARLDGLTVSHNLASSVGFHTRDIILSGDSAGKLALPITRYRRDAVSKEATDPHSNTRISLQVMV